MKKKVAVLHSQVPFIRGGAEIMLETLTAKLRERGFEADMVSLPFKWYPNNCLLDSYAMWRTVDLSESNGSKIDLVICLKTPTFMVKHKNKMLWLMHQHRAAYDLANSVQAGGFHTVAGGEEMIKKITFLDTLGISEFKDRYTISKNVTQRLKHFNGIESTPLYHPPSLAGRYYFESMGDYILSVGRLDSTKRVDLIIKALQYCDKKITAVIAGKGNEMDNLKKLADSLGVSDRVRFLGFVPDDELLKLYSECLGVCFPPIDEDYGYITLEAFLSKKPIVTCRDSGGVLEFVKNGENGFICDVLPEELGEKFEELYKNKKTAEEMGFSGYDVVKDICWDNVIDELTKSVR